MRDVLCVACVVLTAWEFSVLCDVVWCVLLCVVVCCCMYDVCVVCVVCCVVFCVLCGCVVWLCSCCHVWVGFTLHRNTLYYAHIAPVVIRISYIAYMSHIPYIA